MASSGSKTYLVEFPGQYNSPDREVECVRDRFGVWRTATGSYMPEPKEVAKGIYIRLICAPQFVVDRVAK